jgi:S-DNA-T family DNA segregation ATPase FtsK/SpoIIIE
MPQARSLARDLSALVLAAAAVILSVALLSFDSGDPPGRQVFPPPADTSNLCGPLGARVAHVVLSGFGAGAWLWVAGLFWLAVLMWVKGGVSSPKLRSIGFLLSLFSSTTLAAMLFSGFSAATAAGPGGYLGAAGRGFLEMHFARAGACILLLSLLAAGLLLWTDYLLLRLAAVGMVIPLKWGASAWESRVGRGKHDRGKRRAAGRDDLAGAGAGEPNVRISGKRAESAPAAATSGEDGESGGGEPGSESSEATSEAAGSRVDDLPSPRIKKPGRRSDRDSVMAALDEASRTGEETEYELPSVELLLPGENVPYEEHEKEVRHKAKILETTFANFGFNVRVVEVETGPVIAQYEVELEAGLRLSKITGLSDDLAIALRVPSVRIVAPIPGKNTVGIEVPNATRQIVRLREVVEEGQARSAKMRIPVYLGKDVAGNPMVVDLTTLPHLLIAGRTGTGKSVCLNTIIMSILMARRPDEVRMLLIDPKMVELSPYTRLPHLMHPVVTDMKKAEAILAWAVEKMEERYALLARAGVRHISSYNQLGEEELMDRLQPEDDEARAQIPTNLPFIVIVADEMADLMMTAAKEVETHIIRLAQKSRAVGIHLVLATQKPTVDVITGLIKSNLPARISFQVASRTDSRVVLDEMGADKLLGNGDLLFLWPGTSTLLRGQGAYVSDDEINKVVTQVGTTEPQFVQELVQLPVQRGEDGSPGRLPHRDDLYEAAVDIVVNEGRGSVSLLQRTLGIGYGRAARLIDYMAEDGIVGQYNGSQAREVLLTLEQWREMSGAEKAPQPVAKNGRKVQLSADGPRSRGAAPDEPVEVEEEEEEGQDDSSFEEEADAAEESDEPLDVGETDEEEDLDESDDGDMEEDEDPPFEPDDRPLKVSFGQRR